MLREEKANVYIYTNIIYVYIIYINILTCICENLCIELHERNTVHSADDFKICLARYKIEIQFK